MPDVSLPSLCSVHYIMFLPCGISSIILDIRHAVKKNKYRGGIWLRHKLRATNPKTWKPVRERQVNVRHFFYSTVNLNNGKV